MSSYVCDNEGRSLRHGLGDAGIRQEAQTKTICRVEASPPATRRIGRRLCLIRRNTAIFGLEFHRVAERKRAFRVAAVVSEVARLALGARAIQHLCGLSLRGDGR